MARVISIHEYDLKPGADVAAFEQAVRHAERRGLFALAGLVEHHFLKGIKGVNRYNPVDPPFSKNAPLRPARGLRRGVSFLCWHGRFSLLFIQDAHRGFCVFGGFFVERASGLPH